MTGTALAISAGLAAAGAGVSAYSNNQAMRKQDSAAAQGIERQGEFQRQAEADVGKNVRGAQQNQTNVDKNQTTLQDQYAAALQRAAPAQATQGAVPGGSKKYATGVAQALAANKQFGTDLAGRTAAIDAPGLTNMQTQLGMGDTATKLGLLSDQSNMQNQLTQEQVKSIQSNPWLDTLGSVLSEGANAYGSYAGYNKVGANGLGGGGTGGSAALSQWNMR